MGGQLHVRVMIVEDEPTFQELVQLVLSLDPMFEVISAAGTGEEALERLEEACPDLVLLDFHLPGMDGLETARYIKRQCPNTRIALVTAHVEDVLERLAKNVQIQEVIPKSKFSLERVRALLPSPPEPEGQGCCSNATRTF